MTYNVHVGKGEKSDSKEEVGMERDGKTGRSSGNQP
jgi:hypothetical protein